MNWCYVPRGRRPGDHDTIMISTDECYDDTICAAFQNMGLPLDPYRDLCVEGPTLGLIRREIATIRKTHREAIAQERLRIDADRPLSTWQLDAIERLLAEDPLEDAMARLSALFERAEREGGYVNMLGE